MIHNMVCGGGGGSGGTLTVTGVAGHTVTATKDGKSYTRIVNSSGVAVFKGLETGEWILTMTGDGQTATRTVTVTADYAVTITYFAATISITYPAASTCTVQNSSGTTVASDSNTGEDAKTWACTVGAADTYTITATDGSKSKDTTVEITADGQSESVTLSYELVLFDGGDITALTGGWDASKTTTSGLSSSVGTTISLSASDDTGVARAITLTTKNAIDFTGYSTLLATVSSCKGGGTMKVGSSASVSINTAGNVSLDVSGISSSKTIAFEVSAYLNTTSSAKLVITKVWLE